MMRQPDTTFVFIRHGEVNNPQRIIYGRTVNVPLSEEGFAQIHALGTKLKKIGLIPDIVYTSPLLRAVQSTETLMKIFSDTPVVEVDDLQDGNEPDLATKTLDWLESIGGNIYDRDNPELQGLNIEEPESMAKRIVESVEKMRKDHEGKTVFVVGHGDPFAFGLSRLLNPHSVLPSITELNQGGYLKKGEAWRMVLDAANRVITHEIIPRDETALRGEREY